MRFIGLDVAYRNVGVVILDYAGDLVESTHLKCPATRDPDGFLWHWNAADLFLPGDVVAIEGLSFGSFGKSHLLAGAHSAWLTEAVMGSSWVFVPVPLRVKLWATGSAKATKQEMIAWARSELGERCSPKRLSEHEADALALAQIAHMADRVRKEGPTACPPDRLKLFMNPKKTGLLDTENTGYYRGMYG